MNLSVGELLSNRMHISGSILEEYILGLLDEKTQCAVEKHLTVCVQCRSDIESAEQTMRRFSNGEREFSLSPPRLVQETGGKAEQCFKWKGGSKLWLNDASYTLMPVADNPGVARVESLTLWQFLDKKTEDEKSPGSCLASIEGDQIMMVFPISRFEEMQLALAAGGSLNAGYNSSASSQEQRCITRRLLQYIDQNFTLDLLTDEVSNVYLGARLNGY